MINLEDGTINLGAKALKIKAFEVWFRTPVGLASTLQFAVDRCKELDYDPRLCIVPVIMVTTDDPTIYEEIPR